MMPNVGGVADYLLGKLTANERATMMRVSDKIIGRMADWFEEHHAGTHLKHP
jgi:peptidyl-tRNA hydrolase